MFAKMMKAKDNKHKIPKLCKNTLNLMLNEVIPRVEFAKLMKLKFILKTFMLA